MVSPGGWGLTIQVVDFHHLFLWFLRAGGVNGMFPTVGNIPIEVNPTGVGVTR